jgi:hypothetical protein
LREDQGRSKLIELNKTILKGGIMPHPSRRKTLFPAVEPWEDDLMTACPPENWPQRGWEFEPFDDLLLSSSVKEPGALDEGESFDPFEHQLKESLLKHHAARRRS